MKKVIIVVDMQNDFIDGSLGTKEAAALVAPLAKRLETAQKENIDIIFTQDTHGEDYLSTQEGIKLPVKHCIKPEKGWEIHPLLQPFAQNAVVVEKPTFGAVDLPPKVADYDEIILCGVCTGICVISNAIILKAHYPEKIIAVEKDFCACVNPASHQTAIEAMALCQIEIR